MQTALPEFINTEKEIAVKISDLKTLICLLQTPDPNVIVTALDALCRFADGGVKNKSTMISLGVTKIVMDLMTSVDKKIKKSAVACIAICTQESIPEIKKLLEILVSILKTEDQVDILDETAEALANTSKEFSHKVVIKKLGGIAALVRCIGMTDPDVRLNSAIALSNVLDDFGCRPDLRNNNGLKPLLDLLSSEHPEVLDNALKCIAKASEDAGNRTEFKKIDISKKLVEFLNNDRNEALFTQTLTILMLYLDESESINRFAEVNGITALTRLTSHHDNQVKKKTCIALAKSLRNDKIQVMAREAGLLNIISTQLPSLESIISSSCAIAISALSRNDTNLQEFLRMGVLEGLVKHLQGDKEEAKRECMGALAVFAANSGVRTKFQNTLEYLTLIIKVLQCNESDTIVNTCYCIVALCEDAGVRGELLNAGVLATLFTAIEMSDIKVQAAVCLSLSCFLKEGFLFLTTEEARITLAKNPKVISRIVQLLSSPDIIVSQNAAYTISIASQLDTIASAACSTGAVDALVQLSKETRAESKQFAAEALEKILNFNFSAKYWLVNHLSANNTITDGFYDLGYVGCNLAKVGGFPTLQALIDQPVNTRREILLLDSTKDIALNQLTTFLAEAIIGQSPETQVKLIAMAVSRSMGGAIPRSELSSFSYKFRISELKLKFSSNVLLLGQISCGTFYHRALLFKFLCDKLGVKPCLLVRGEYNRAWNVIDIKNMTVDHVVATAKKPTPGSGKKKSIATEIVADTAEQRLGYLGTSEIVLAEPYDFDEPAVIDLMFEPGALIPSSSRPALEYQRHYLQ